MKILCLNPPFLAQFSREQRSPAVTKSGTIYYPMWLAYGAGSLQKAGHDIDLIDSVTKNWTPVEVEAWLLEHKPDMVVCATSTPSISSDLRVADIVKNCLPDTVTVFVGVHVSAEPIGTLESCKSADAVVIGEYDHTLVELADYVADSKRNWKDIRGLAWRDADQITVNDPRPYIEDLDSLPMVAEIYHKHLNYKDYFYSIARWPEVTLITGRGCDHHCIYCVYPQNMTGHRVRYRSIDNVLDEWEYVEKNFDGVRELFIEADAMTLDRERLRKLMARKIERGIKIGFTANSRADVDFETLKWMKKGGCRLLCVGFESGNQSILDNMGKCLKLEQSRQFVRDAKKAGIMIHGCFLVGLPGETHETLAETLEFAKELTPDTAQFFPLMVYPGTAAYKWAKKKGYLLTEDYSKWLNEDGMHNCVVERPDLTNCELVEFCDRARREFYLRPKYIVFKLRQIVMHPEEATRTLKSLKKFWRHLLFGSSKKDKP
ncbi:B12-binding domain-containing radical SAM protein [bacterium]|nr:B12-binding domain-containing radical SAM protein [bacterium]